ncbi:MAG: hypothetical protein HY391_02170 [Deltaproteobacteria bacterium]|nr:hypothetical protein [Deltaproteobacteria bacterium]
MKKGRLAVVLLILFSSFLITSCLPEETERAYLDQAAWLIDKGEYEEAIAILEMPALSASREAQKLLISAYLGSIGVNFEAVGELAQRAMKSRLSTRFVVNELVSLFYAADVALMERRIWKAKQAAHLSGLNRFPLSDFMSNCAVMGVILAKASGDGFFTVEDLDQTRLTDPMATTIIQSALRSLEVLDTFALTSQMRRYVDEMKRFIEGREETPRELRRLLKYYLG